MTQIPVEQKVLSENDKIAARLRAGLAGRGTLSLNFVSSPGSGKTQFLERTLDMLPKRSRAAVLTGDIQTDNDAIRLARYGYPVRQICTGGACHLDARMVENHLADWDLGALDYLFIENVGNLVCPTGYDLGEDAKVVILSVTEGEDKPLKYPGIFRKSELMIVNKIDLLPYVPFWVKLAREHARQINPEIDVIEMSALTGDGFDQWFGWLYKRAQVKRASAAHRAETLQPPWEAVNACTR
ncbi:MAG: hydrogenase nickel incorporation protein HypB [Acidobacteriota bacterium]|nr:hydrogenase nickel incorporation protein HypB [Acidobacteriota bacterium]